VQFSVTPNENLIITAGTSSVPILVHTNYAPNNDVTIQLTLSNTQLEEKVTVSNTVLNYIPDKNSAYFTISVVEEYDISVDPVLLNVQFTIGGTNASSYMAIPDLEF
jgi:hypothetical protein